MPQLDAFVKKVSTLGTRDMQEEILDDMSLKARAATLNQIEALFKRDDPGDRGVLV